MSCACALPRDASRLLTTASASGAGLRELRRDVAATVSVAAFNRPMVNEMHLHRMQFTSRRRPALRPYIDGTEITGTHYLCASHERA